MTAEQWYTLSADITMREGCPPPSVEAIVRALATLGVEWVDNLVLKKD